MVIEMSQVDVRVVVLGRVFSGKTCLVQRFLHRRFVGDELGHRNTLGVAFNTAELRLAEMLETEEWGKRSLVLGIWDTSGDEQYMKIAEMFSRRVDAVIMCFDSFQALEITLDTWLSHFTNQTFTPLIYLCTTKQDLNPKLHEDPRVLRVIEDLNLQKAIATSSKTGFNIDQLFENIARDFVEKQVLFYQSLNKRESIMQEKNNICNLIANILCCR